MKCQGCGKSFSEEELSLDEYCSYCESIMCDECGIPSEDLEDGVCENCRLESTEIYGSCKDDRYS